MTITACDNCKAHIRPLEFLTKYETGRGEIDLCMHCRNALVKATKRALSGSTKVQMMEMVTKNKRQQSNPR